MPGKLDGSKSIASGTITTTQLATALSDSIAAGGGPKIKNLIYPGDDTAANNVGGQTIYINGSGFDSNVAVYVNNASVPSVTYISASNVGFTTPALSAATYPLYVTNPDDGATAILVPGLQISGEPTWVTGATLTTQDAAIAWSISLSATGDTPLTYALAAGSSLPSGISLASNGVISGTMSSPPASETTYNFTVDVSDAQNQSSSRAFSVTVTTGEGVLFANNVLLIHANGTNNGNNHSFLDSSNNNFTITRNGNATQGSFSPFSQTGWSAFFDGTGDYLTTNNSNVNNFGTSDWTIEFWINSTQTLRADPIGWNYLYSSAGWAGLILNVAGSGSQMSWYEGSNQTINATSTGWNNGAWNHIAITRSGNSIKMFLNGVQQGSTYTTSLSYGANSSGFIIGINFDGNGAVTGNISNVRIVKGTAVYTSAFTPPTAPLTAIANTSLLTCQSNRFIDNSNNTFTITRSGDVLIQPYSPLAPTAEYSTANVGGSVYFDGTGDYLSYGVGNTSIVNWYSQSTTMEAWIYPTAYTTFTNNYGATFTNGDINSNSNYWGFGINSNKLRFVYFGSGGTSSVESTGIVLLNTWTHIAFVYNHGDASIKLFINGVLDGSASKVGTPQSDANLGIKTGGWNGGYFSGYMSGARMLQGTALYTASFTPPTAPLTNVANTRVLLSATNAQIFDQTAKINLECIGNVVASTAQYKYGSASMYFDGTGDYLFAPANKLFAFRTGDFTIEFWIRSTDSAGNLIGLVTNASGNWNLVIASSQLYWQSQYATTNTFNRSATGILDGAWHHVAITRASGTMRMFFDGTLQGATASDSTDYTAPNAMQIGSSGVYADFLGYIDDLRITKGYARYTANFTAPTAQFKDQ